MIAKGAAATLKNLRSDKNLLQMNNCPSALSHEENYTDVKSTDRCISQVNNTKPKQSHTRENPLHHSTVQCTPDTYKKDLGNAANPCFNFSTQKERKPTNTMGEFHHDDELQDQPINYSLKYSDSSNITPSTNKANIILSKGNPYVHAASDISYDGSNMDNLDEPTNYGRQFVERVSINTKQPDYTEKFPADTNLYGNKLNNTPYSRLVNNSQYTPHTPNEYASRNESPYTPQTIRHYDDEDSFEDTITSFCTEDTPAMSASTSPDQKSDFIIQTVLSKADNVSNIAVSSTDEPITYLEEGTPACFSRASSLSSLHSTDDDHDCTILHPEHPTDSKNLMYSTNQSDPSSVSDAIKSEDIIHVQQTPMMFSRASSLASLDSFDAESIHSDVVSDHSSRRASEVVSPSDLPDSPGTSMPSSPKRTAYLKLDKANVNTHNIITQGNQENSCFGDCVTNFAISHDENTNNDFSCATSLSALTFDDEPFIPKSPKLHRVEEEDLPGTDSPGSVSEGDEELLSQCINSAVPYSRKEKKRIHAKNSSKHNRYSSSTISTTHSEKTIKSNDQQQFTSKESTTSFHKKEYLQGNIHMQSITRLSSLANHTELDRPSQYLHENSGSNRPYCDVEANLSLSSSEDDTDLAEAILSETINAAMPKSKKKKNTASKSASMQSKRNEAVYSHVNNHKDKYPTAFTYNKPMPTNHNVYHADVSQGKTLTANQNHFSTVNNNMGRFSKVVNRGYTESSSISKFNPSSTPLVDDASIYHADDVKTYAVEGTPLNFSRAESLSDLSEGDVDEECTNATTSNIQQQHPVKSSVDMQNEVLPPEVMMQKK